MKTTIIKSTITTLITQTIRKKKRRKKEFEKEVEDLKRKLERIDKENKKIKNKNEEIVTKINNETKIEKFIKEYMGGDRHGYSDTEILQAISFCKL